MNIQHSADKKTVILKQVRLIDRKFLVTGMDDFKPNPTHAETSSLGKDADVESCRETWNCISAVGIIL